MGLCSWVDKMKKPPFKKSDLKAMGSSWSPSEPSITDLLKAEVERNIKSGFYLREMEARHRFWMGCLKGGKFPKGMGNIR